MSILLDFFRGIFVEHYSLLIAAWGSLSFALAAGLLSPWIMLRHESFLADITAHASLAGIAAFLLLPIEHSPITTLIGGTLAAWFAQELYAWLNKHSSLKKESILACILAISSALALVLITRLIQAPSAIGGLSPGELAALGRRFLLGSPASILKNEAILLSAIAGIILLVSLFATRAWLLLTFTNQWSDTIGFPRAHAHRIFRFLSIILILAGILSVGTLMVSALIIAPAVIARTINSRIQTIIFISTALSLLFMSLALFIATQKSGFPEGPVAVFLASGTAVLVLTCAILIPKIQKKASSFKS